MGYYDICRKCAIDLTAWVNNPKRGPWSCFCSIMRRRYGFGPARMRKMLEEDYPDFELDGEELINLREAVKNE